MIGRGAEWRHGGFGGAGAALAVRGAARASICCGPGYVRKTFVRHTHENFVIAAIADGVEVFHHRGADQYAGPGRLWPWSTRTRRTPAGPACPRAGGTAPSTRRRRWWPEIAAETTLIRGTPGFVRPGARRSVRRRTWSIRCCGPPRRATRWPPTRLLRVAVTRLLRLNGGPLPQRAVRTAGARVAARARAVLEERMVEPPTLERLAADLGTSPFALLRAFRDAYGMPPHTWLTDARVRRARRLLDAGTTPAEAAVAVGFTDQPHLQPALHPDRGRASGGVPAGALGGRYGREDGQRARAAASADRRWTRGRKNVQDP